MATKKGLLAKASLFVKWLIYSVYADSQPNSTNLTKLNIGISCV